MFEKPPFSEADEKRILNAIAEAERNTSGEIRVHLEKRCKKDPVAEAIEVFDRLKMHNTALRNGVLILVALEDHKFAIIGDKGINEVVPENFWEQTKGLMLGHFKEGRIVDGIIEGILDAGVQLKAHFPFHQEDANELKNDISYGEKHP